MLLIFITNLNYNMQGIHICTFYQEYAIISVEILHYVFNCTIDT
jgi:hypothetical protein